MDKKTLYGKVTKRAFGGSTLELLLSEPDLPETDYDISSDVLLEAGHEGIIMAELKEKLMALKDKLSQMEKLIEDVKCSLYS